MILTHTSNSMKPLISMDNNLPYVAPIKLSREHTPIHPDCLIKNQQQYDYHISMLNFLNSQLDAGFKPKWMITTHLYHPREDYRNVPEMYSFKGGIPKTRWGRKTPLPNKFNRHHHYGMRLLNITIMTRGGMMSLRLALIMKQLKYHS